MSTGANLRRKSRATANVTTDIPLTQKGYICAQLYALHPEWTEQKICNESGYSSITMLYKMKQNAQFWDVVEETLQAAWKDSFREAQQKMIDLMRQGNYRATEYILNCAGYEKPKQFDVNAITTINVTIDEPESKSE